MENGRCRNHGGLTPSGAASVHFKTGRYSKVIPSHLKDDYESSLADPDLLSLREEVALLDTRRKELLALMQQLKTPPWGTVLILVKMARSKLSDGEEIDDELIELERTVQEGFDAVRDYERTWHEVQDLIQDKAKAAGAEWKRMEALGAVVTASEVMTVLVGFLGCVSSRIGALVALNSPVSPEVLKRLMRDLQEDWNRIVGSRPRRSVEAGQLVTVGPEPSR